MRHADDDTRPVQPEVGGDVFVIREAVVDVATNDLKAPFSVYNAVMA